MTNDLFYNDITISIKELMLTSFAKTHIGQRTTNEDFILVDEKLGLYIVADGVGGRKKGDLASKIACQKVRQCIEQGNMLDYAVYEAHGALVDQIESNGSKHEMATTIAAVLFSDNKYQISWVGDTRVYLWDQKLKLLTRDDTYVQQLYDDNRIYLEDLVAHPDRNIITQALGMRRKEVTIHSNFGTLEKNQILMICSDGLYEIANELDIINELDRQKGITELTEKLVNIAVKNDGMDNISLISIKSESNTKQPDRSFKPHVVREFELKANTIKNDRPAKKHQHADPNLVNITVLQELTKQEQALLESAADQWNPKIERKTNVKTPLILIGLVILVITFLYFLL